MDRAVLARNVAAFVLVVAACPVALFGSVALGCASVGYTGRCAADSMILSPIILVATGILAALLARGLAGLAIVVLGVLLGMLTLLWMSEALGHPLPIDPVQAAIATIWFLTPTAFGYLVARGAIRAIGWAMEYEDVPGTEPQPGEPQPG